MSEKVDALKQYIDAYWDTLRVENTDESKTALGLPNPYYVPSVEVIEGFSFPHMFYWDTYFIVQGFWGTHREFDTVGIAENMFDMIRRFGFVPNSNSFSHLSRSQPPLLTTLVLQISENLKKDDSDWLEIAYARTSEELKTVWLGSVQPHNRLVHQGLSRYYDTNVLDVLAEAESGWDYTTRFEDSCLDFLPIDLNSLLYKYEADLAKMAISLGRENDASIWSNLAQQRKATMSEIMWHEDDGLFYDYDYKLHRLGGVQSLAAYVPMFAGMASDEQAHRLVENLPIFETEFGLTTTSKNGLASADKQWTSPNGWAPLHDLVVDGLLQYGYTHEAVRIAEKWVNMVAESFARDGVLYEKYNVIDPSIHAGGSVYPDQVGFGWTNGVTAKFIKLLESK